MCTCFVEAVRPFAEGMISRYDDTYEPRAFGDGIQSLGVATMLVEAGGWPEADVEPMTRLHFHGLLNTLHAIATDKYLAADHQIYEDLPESNSQRLNDCLITKGQRARRQSRRAVRGRSRDRSNALGSPGVTTSRDGKIVDIGDLPARRRRLTIDASNSLCFPGNSRSFAIGSRERAFDEQTNRRAAGSGNDDRDLASSTWPIAMRSKRWRSRNRCRINWAFVGNADDVGQAEAAASSSSASPSRPPTACWPSSATAPMKRCGDTSIEFGLPLLKPNQLAGEPGRQLPGCREAKLEHRRTR